MACRGQESEGDHPDMDRGWAWVVAVAVMSYNFLIGGTYKSYGLFYAEFIHWFPEGPAAVGLISLMFGISGIIFAPLGGRLSDSVSPRKMVFVGGLVISASFALTSLAPNLVTAVVTYGVFAGASIGIIDGPVLSYIGRYFRRKRNLASGIVWMGSSVGNMALAPLFSLMISEYGIKGTLLLLGGLWTHVCIIALLLRHPKQRPKTNIKTSSQDQLEPKQQPEITIKTSSQDELQPKKQAETTTLKPSQDELQPELQPKQQPEITIKTSSQDQIQCSDHELHMQSRPVLSSDIELSGMSQDKASSDNVHNMEFTEGSMTILNVICDDTQVPDYEKEINPTIALLDVPNTRDASTELPNNLCHEPDQPEHCKRGDVIKRTSYCTFLRNIDMWRVVISLGCGFYGYYTPLICIPVWGEELALSTLQVAALLSVVGAVEIVSRLLLGYMADLPCVSISLLLTVSYIIMGIAGQLIVLLPSFTSLMVYVVVHGMFGGTAHVLMTSLLFRTVTLDWVGSATGLAVVQLHISASIASTTGGLMKEVSGSYSHIIQVSSGVYLLGVLIYNTGLISSKLKSRLSSKHQPVT